MAVVHHPAVARPERPVVSVCIANYNGGLMLADCIGSVLEQQGIDPGCVEIIIHDDASTDDSLAWLRRHHPQVELLASEDNVGFCVGNNRMVDVARGDYVLLLNNDAALAPDAIGHLLHAAERIGASAILTLPQHDWDTGTLVDRGCLLDPFCNPVPNLDAARDDVAYVIGACLWCPRAAWHALGGFPKWMESIGEDLYLCGLARLRAMPVRALFVSGYRHRQGATFGGNRAGDAGLQSSLKRRRLSERNKTRALMILVPGFVMWPLLGLHLLALVIEGAVLCLLKQDAMLWHEIYWHALTTPFRESQVLLARRREVQATRAIPASGWFATVSWQLRKVALLLRHGVPSVS